MIVIRSIVYLLIACALPAASARAQGPSPAELRQRVDELTAQTEDLRARLSAAESQLAALRTERDDAQTRLAQSQQLVAQLQQQLALLIAERLNQPQAPVAEPVPTAAPEAAVVPDDPMAAPAALFEHLRMRYQEDLAALPRATPEEMDRFVRDAQRWCRMMNSKVRGRVTWLVRMEGIGADEQGRAEARIQVLDPATFKPVGEPFRTVIASRWVERVRRGHAVQTGDKRGARVSMWELTAMFTANPAVNPEREIEGPFNVPPLIGPLVEFGYQIEWLGAVEARDAGRAADAPEAPK